MHDALRVTAAGIIAAVDAGEAVNLPHRMTPAERREVADAMRHYMRVQDLLVSDAGAKVGVNCPTRTHKYAKEFGLKSSPEAILRFNRAHIAAKMPADAADRGRAKRWGDRPMPAPPATPARERHEAINQRIQGLRLAGMSRRSITEELSVSLHRVNDVAKRFGPVRAVGEGKWAQAERDRAERTRARREANRVRAEEAAVKLRDLARLMTVSEAARRLGMPAKYAEMIARRYVIKSAVRYVPMPRPSGPRPKAPKAKQPKRLPPGRERPVFVNDPSKAAPPNARLSAAQQQQVDVMKRQIGFLLRSTNTVSAPPPSREEADRLIAEAIAAGRITRCPPGFAATVNNGTGL